MYVCVGLFFWGLLEFYLATENNNGALYTFAALLPVWMGTIGFLVCLGNRDRQRKIKRLRQERGIKL